MEVSFRTQGETDWSSALPLLRLHGERIFSGTRFDVIAPNMFAGSILDLEPDTLTSLFSFNLGVEATSFWSFRRFWWWRSSPVEAASGVTSPRWDVFGRPTVCS